MNCVELECNLEPICQKSITVSHTALCNKKYSIFTQTSHRGSVRTKYCHENLHWSWTKDAKGTVLQDSPACTSFHDMVLSQRDKLLNPFFSCRSLHYTTRKSLQQSPEVRVSSAGVHYTVDFPRTKLFFLGTQLAPSSCIWSAFNKIYLKNKTVQ